MSLYGVLRTSTSGMAAQAGRLATVADNIANVSTNGYKRAYSDFASLLIAEAGGQYTSGGVLNQTRHTISEQGSLRNTQSVTDLAIRGDGFFIVADANGQPFLYTRRFVREERKRRARQHRRFPPDGLSAAGGPGQPDGQRLCGPRAGHHFVAGAAGNGQHDGVPSLPTCRPMMPLSQPPICLPPMRRQRSIPASHRSSPTTISATR